MSLKSNLNQIIKERGEITLNELEVLCKQMQYKLSNAERRLRPSESPEIERVIKNGVIVAYRFKKLKEWWKEPKYQKEVKPQQLGLKI